MLIGVPKEIKDYEYRVSISPNGVRELVYHGHQVIVEKDAGHDLGFEDGHYQDAGALVMERAVDIFDRADLIVKVKEPQLSECHMLKDSQLIFCYLHLAAESAMTNTLLESNCIAIAYETVTDANNQLPLLAPMSEVAGRLAVQAGASCLERSKQGRGVLLGGVPGVAAGKVTILGGGTVGTHAALIARGMGANVTLLERSVERIRELDMLFKGSVNVIFSTVDAIEEYVLQTDLLIGAILIPGASAPKVVSEALVKKMRRGAVIVDVAIDQGGCIETSEETTHGQPTFIKHEVVHYCVSNMPSTVARTATKALEHATLPYILDLANNGYRAALKGNKGFMNGLNIYRGRITHEEVAKALNHAYVPPATFLG